MRKADCGALHFTSQIKLNNELGLETIATRADFLSLNTFHKILVGRTRPLVRSCMPTPTPINEHSTRHRKLCLPYKSNSIKFTNSFFPEMAKQYENLPRSCRSKADPDLFKDELRSHLVPIRYKFLSRGNIAGRKTSYPNTSWEIVIKFSWLYCGEITVPTVSLSFPPGVTLSLFPWLLPLHRGEEVTTWYFWALHTRFYIF